MGVVGRLNLMHVLEAIGSDDGTCGDPDCEIHNPITGLEEGTVDLTQLAYFIAGHNSEDADHIVEEARKYVP